MTLARDERLALCALLDQTGPDAPTLCEGWTTLDLAAHLVLREHRLDAAAGIVIRPLAGLHPAGAAHAGPARSRSPAWWTAIRDGPPRLSPFGLPGVDERANLVEFFVHHEDVRRGAPDWAERKVTPALSEALWRRLGMARFVLRKAPVGVELVRDDIGPDPAGAGCGSPPRRARRWSPSPAARRNSPSGHSAGPRPPRSGWTAARRGARRSAA